MHPVFLIRAEIPLPFLAAALFCAAFTAGGCKKASDSSQSRLERKSGRPAISRHDPPRRENARAVFGGLAGEPKNRYDIIESAREKCAKLQEEDLDAVFDILRSGPPGATSPSMWHLLANEVMEELRKRDLPSLPSRLFSLASDEDVPGVIRDYAAQHYMLAEMQALRSLSGAAPARRSERVQRILDNAERLVDPPRATDSTLPGTTMLALAAVAESLEGEDLETLRSGAGRFVTPFLNEDSPAAIATKVSAIQAAARIGIPGAGARIAEIAGDPGAGFSERLSSVAALRFFPENADIAWLRSLAENPGKLRYAAAETLAHLPDNQPSPKNTQ